jgi:hypothetical protein
LGERRVRNAEVSGSIPLSSTSKTNRRFFKVVVESALLCCAHVVTHLKNRLRTRHARELRFATVRNAEVSGSIPLSSTSQRSRWSQGRAKTSRHAKVK